jgi:group I intron endonuclease
MHCTIYKITNKINGKLYIGKHLARNLEDGYFGSGKWLKNAVRKYGVMAFEKHILFDFKTEKEMNDKEAELVTEDFCKRPDTYNLCVGGSGGFSYINRNRLNYPMKEVTREKISKSLRGRKSPISRERLKRLHDDGKMKHIRHDTFIGKKHTDATKIKMSISAIGKHTGRKNSQFGTIWITDGLKSRKLQTSQTIPHGWWRGRKRLGDAPTTTPSSSPAQDATLSR